MALCPIDLHAAHRAFGSSSAIIERRRAVYSAVLELVAAESDLAETADLLDSPLVRAHLGMVVNGGRLQPEAMTPLSALGVDVRSYGDNRQVRIIADSAARAALDGAVAHLRADLGAETDDSGSLRLLLRPDPGYNEASDLVIDGLRTATAISPQLAEDLLPHVTAFAVVTGTSVAKLGSASLREYPGLIIVPRPRSAIEIAEALIHEGAHQLFFDLSVTFSMLPAPDRSAPTFHPSWAATSRSRWPLDQCLAAYHAYTSLAAFHKSFLEWRDHGTLHDFSLLPHAEDRAAELGGWLGSQAADHLGPDGLRFIKLLGSPVPSPPRYGFEIDLERTADRTTVRSFEDRVLFARLQNSIELMWLPSITSAQQPK